MTKRGSSAAPWGAAAVAALGLAACNSEEAIAPEDSEATAARRALLASEVENAILPTFERLVVSTAALERATAAYAAEATTTGTTSGARASARSAFEEMMLDLEAAELFQIGPYGPASKFAGGQGIRDEMYSWPIVSPCRVDQETVEAEFDNPGFFEREIPNVYGADALERLLFAEGTENACPQPHVINQNGTWAALGADGIAENRARYAVRVAERLAADARRVRDAWTGGFAESLRSAGQEGSAYRDTQQAIDELFASMFYFEREVKDTKLGAPLGITAACSDEVCPDLLESQFAGRSLEWARANVEAFQTLFFAGEASDAGRRGFDDLLEDAGAVELSARMTANLQAVVTAGAAVPTPLRDNLRSEAARAFHAAMVDLATDLKTQFVSVLALRVPSEGAADND